MNTQTGYQGCLSWVQPPGWTHPLDTEVAMSPDGPDFPSQEDLKHDFDSLTVHLITETVAFCGHDYEVHIHYFQSTLAHCYGLYSQACFMGTKITKLKL